MVTYNEIPTVLEQIQKDLQRILSLRSKESTEDEGASRQIKHLTHVEDRPLQNGEKGAQHAISSLAAAADHIREGKKTSELTTKYDGSPAIVYGHHPENGKFFVASKSAFNKTPKINYTPADIEKNHGHAPGLVVKLKSALKHLPNLFLGICGFCHIGRCIL